MVCVVKFHVCLQSSLSAHALMCFPGLLNVIVTMASHKDERDIGTATTRRSVTFLDTPLPLQMLVWPARMKRPYRAPKVRPCPSHRCVLQVLQHRFVLCQHHLPPLTVLPSRAKASGSKGAEGEDAKDSRPAPRLQKGKQKGANSHAKDSLIILVYTPDGHASDEKNTYQRSLAPAPERSCLFSVLCT